MKHNPSRDQNSDMTRRGFLATAAAAAAVPSTLAIGAQGEETPALRVPPGTQPSRVVKMAARELIQNGAVHRPLLREMVRKVVTTLARTRVERDAWHSFLGADDVIGLKFNRSAQATLATTEAMAETLIQSIVEAGFSPKQIVCIEEPAGLAQRNGTTPAVLGYSPTETKFASGADQLALVLNQVDAIINVPFLKTHNIAGMTCSLKNLSHAMVKHPARFHANRCSPYISDIVNLPAIRKKLRLHIVDALRVVYDGGPEASSGAITNHGMILASTDPVSIDTIGLEVLNDARKYAGLRGVARNAAELPYLKSGHEAGLGIAARYAIDVVQPAL
jgi:Domain of unknown function (DUF362)